MKIWCLNWGLDYVYLFAETEEEALKKVRDNKARLKEEMVLSWNVDRMMDPPDYIDSDDLLITHFGSD